MYNFKLQPYFIILGAFLINITLGGFFTAGGVKKMIFLYMKNSSHSHSEVTIENISWLFGIILLGMGATISLGGFIEMKIGSSLTAILGGWFMSLNVLLMYATLKSYLWVVIISFGLLAGFGIGIAYGITLGATSKWFKKRKGLAIGISISGYGFSPVIFLAIQTSLIYKNNKLSLPDFPYSFIIIASIFACLQFIGSLLIHFKNINLLNSLLSEPTSINSDPGQRLFSQSSKYQNKMHDSHIKPHHLIWIPDFWILWIILLLNSICVTLINAVYVPFLEHQLVRINIKNMSIIFACFNGLGRIFWGYFIDIKSFKVVMLCLTVTNSFLFIILPTISYLKYSQSHYIYITCVSIINLCTAGNYSIFPTICANLFGVKFFVCNYGMLYTGCSVGGIISSLLMTYTNENFMVVFYIGGGVSFIAALITTCYRGISKKVFLN